MVLKIEVHESAIKGANRSNIPKTLVKSKTSKESDNLWMDFAKKVWMPLKISDKGSIKILQGVKLKLTIDWTEPRTGASSSAEVQTGCDKSGLYWFASILMYVSGNVKLTIATVPLEIDGKKIKAFERSYVVEGDDNDDIHVMKNNNTNNEIDISKVGKKKSKPPLGHSKLLVNDNLLKRKIKSTTEITGDVLSLDLSETHCKMIFDDHLNIKMQDILKKKSKQTRSISSGDIDLNNISSEIYMTSSDIMNKAEKSVHLDSGSSEDIFNKIRAAYEVFFESKLLYNTEKSIYEEIIKKARRENVPLAEVTDEIFLLRLLIFLCLNIKDEVEDEIGLEEGKDKESKPRPRGRPPKESKEKKKEKDTEVTSPSAKRRKVVQNKMKSSLYNLRRAVVAILKEINDSSLTV